MTVLGNKVNPHSPTYLENQQAMLALIEDLESELELSRAGGGEKYVQRHKERGKLLARERIELLLDPDSPFLELCPLAAWGTSFNVGASLIFGLGVVEDTICVISANDPTVKGGASNPYTMKKAHRAADIARENRLPLINLVESGGADLPNQAEIFIPGGRMFRDLTQLSAEGIPTISLVFGNSTAGGAYVPGMSDYIVMVKERAKVFLGGPPLVKMATGEESDDEELGGAEMHARVSGLCDFMAENELDCIGIGRQIVKRLNVTRPGGWRTITDKGARGYGNLAVLGHGSLQRRSFGEPKYSQHELLGIPSSDAKIPYDPRDVLARILDSSDFDEFKPLYGTSLVTGWGSIYGFPIGILANHRGVLFSQEAQKATQFIQLANQSDTPLVFLQNTTGYMVGKDYEQGGIIKDGAKMINAVSNSRVPHLTINIGASYGAGNYGMCGKAFNPRFLFAWPNARSSVMGSAQLAGVLSIVARQAAEAQGREFDEAADQEMRSFVEAQIESESIAKFISGRLYDDGIIDPRDTRTVLGMCLEVVYQNGVAGTRGYGIYRM